MQKKTNFILFHTKNKPIPDNLESIQIGDVDIKRARTVKYIGVNIDELLTWKVHVESVCNSLLKYFGIFNNIKNFVTRKIARQIYFAFVFSRINYGIEVYGSCSGYLNRKIQILQNRLLKMLLNLDRLTSTNQLHKELRILKINDIYRVNLLNLVNKAPMEELPPCFIHFFYEHETVHNTRNAGSLFVRRSKTVT